MGITWLHLCGNRSLRADVIGYTGEELRVTRVRGVYSGANVASTRSKDVRV